MSLAKKVKTAMSLDSEVIAGMQELADRRHGGNLSQAINSALQNELELARGPMSKVFQFSSEISGIFRSLSIQVSSCEHAVDWILPELSLGIEAKIRFTAGKAETATVAAMAYTVGHGLCTELWIVGADAMSAEDRKQWDRVAREFHLCPARFIFGSQLEMELIRRKKDASLKEKGSAPENHAFKSSLVATINERTNQELKRKRTAQTTAPNPALSRER